MRPLIVLRPEPGASATVQSAREMGLDATAMPLFQVRPTAWEVPEPGSFDALLLTSANAVRHGGEGLQTLRGLKAYCVGEGTAKAARDAGFDIAATGSAGVDRLLGSIDSDIRLLHLAGEHRTDAPDARQDITVRIVYSADDLPTPEQIGAAEGGVVAIHSGRAARRFADIAQERRLDRASITIASISNSAACELGEGWQQVEVAESADDPSLLALARTLCNKPAES